MAEAETSYLVKKAPDKDGIYDVKKYLNDVQKETYRVDNGVCDCPGYRIKRKRGGVCKHVSMVLKFDPVALDKASTEVTGVRDEVAQRIYERIAEGLSPFVDTISLQEMKRNPATEGVVGLHIHATPHRQDDATVTKLTGYVDNVIVVLLIE